MSALETYKLIAAPAVLVAGLAGGALPRWQRLRQHRTLLAVANCFAAGIFFGAGLLHMIPDASRALAPFTDYPLAPLLATAAFVLLLFIEQVLLQRRDTDAASDMRGSMVAYVVALALSVHALIAGLALGTQRTVGDFAVVLAAILAHKSSAAFALGRVLAQSAPSTLRYGVIVALFACSTPTGILVGSVVAALLHGHAAQVVSGLFDGLAAGTFLYVGIADVLPRELRRHHDALALCAGFTAGIVVMAVVRIWT